MALRMNISDFLFLFVLFVKFVVKNTRYTRIRGSGLKDMGLCNLWSFFAYFSYAGIGLPIVGR